MVEQADVLLDECDAELLSSREHGLIVLTASGRRDILHTRSTAPEDIIDERELRGTD